MVSPLWFVHIALWLAHMIHPPAPRPRPVLTIRVRLASRPVDALVLLVANRYLAGRGLRLGLTRGPGLLADEGPKALLGAPNRVGFALVGREDDTALLGPAIPDFRWAAVAGRSIAAMAGTSGQILEFLLKQQGIRPRIVPQTAPTAGRDGADLLQLPLGRAEPSLAPGVARWVDLGPQAGPYLAGILSAPRWALTRDRQLLVTITRAIAWAQAQLTQASVAVNPPPGFLPRLAPAQRSALIQRIRREGLLPSTPQFSRLERSRTAQVLGLDPQHLSAQLDGSIALDALVRLSR